MPCIPLWCLLNILLVALHAELPRNFNAALPNVAFLINGLPHDFLYTRCIYSSIFHNVVVGVTGAGQHKHANPFVFMNFVAQRPKKYEEPAYSALEAVDKLYNPTHVAFDPPEPPSADDGIFSCARWKGDVNAQPLWIKEKEFQQYIHINQSFAVALEYERVHNITFDYFARVRFDVVFGRPLPSLRELYPSASPKDAKWYSPARLRRLSDQFALLPRSAASLYFTIASSIFVDCRGMEIDKAGSTSGELLIWRVMKNLPRATLSTCWFFVKKLPGHQMGWSGQTEGKKGEECSSELQEFRNSCSAS